MPVNCVENFFGLFVVIMIINVFLELLTVYQQA